MRLSALPALADNYIWLLEGDAGAVVVDPGDPAPVLARIERGLQVAAIVITHHHPDHTGGVNRLIDATAAPCHAPADPRIEVDCQRIEDGDCVALAGWRFDVLAVPGHTLSHVAFAGHGVLFCGDTLFSLGCGRLFEGSPAQMLASLDRLAALPGATRVCCGHEYTLANARFALAVDPHNRALQAHVAAVREARASGRPSLPSSIDIERRCNPFLGIDRPAIRAAVAARLGREPRDRVECFAELRRWKDGFRG